MKIYTIRYLDYVNSHGEDKIIHATRTYDAAERYIRYDIRCHPDLVNAKAICRCENYKDLLDHNLDIWWDSYIFLENGDPLNVGKVYIKELDVDDE